MWSWLVRGSAVLGVVIGCACSAGPGVDPLPAGAWLAGRAGALDRVLDGLEGLRGTPLAARAAALRGQLAGCDEFVASAPAEAVLSLLDHARCRGAEALPAALATLRGDRDLVLVLPLVEGARLVGGGHVHDDGRVELELTLDGDPGEGLTRLLIPAVTEAGAPLLSGRDSLLHARLRPDGGLDLADRIAASGQADRLFRLRSRLFAGAVLGEGAWELAVYAPRVGRGTPDLALGLDVAMPGLAEAAIQRFIRDLEATWPIGHRVAEIAGRRGSCLIGLRLLPEFEPCYVATAAGLVVGWNAESVARALDPTPEVALADGGGVVVHLARLPDADARLRESAASGSADTPLEYAWDRLDVRSLRVGDQITWRLELVARGESS